MALRFLVLALFLAVTSAFTISPPLEIVQTRSGVVRMEADAAKKAEYEANKVRTRNARRSRPGLLRAREYCSCTWRARERLFARPSAHATVPADGDTDLTNADVSCLVFRARAGEASGQEGAKGRRAGRGGQAVEAEECQVRQGQPCEQECQEDRGRPVEGASCPEAQQATRRQAAARPQQCRSASTGHSGGARAPRLGRTTVLSPLVLSRVASCAVSTKCQRATVPRVSVIICHGLCLVPLVVDASAGRLFFGVACFYDTGCKSLLSFRSCQLTARVPASSPHVA